MFGSKPALHNNNGQLEAYKQEIEALKKENELYKAIASHSQNEYIVALSGDEVVFKNEKVADIKDFDSLRRSLKEGKGEILTNQNNFKVKSKREGDAVIFYLSEVDSRSKEVGEDLLQFYNKCMHGGSVACQSAFTLTLLEMTEF